MGARACGAGQRAGTGFWGPTGPPQYIPGSGGRDKKFRPYDEHFEPRLCRMPLHFVLFGPSGPRLPNGRSELLGTGLLASRPWSSPVARAVVPSWRRVWAGPELSRQRPGFGLFVWVGQRDARFQVDLCPPFCSGAYLASAACLAGLTPVCAGRVRSRSSSSLVGDSGPSEWSGGCRGGSESVHSDGDRPVGPRVLCGPLRLTLRWRAGLRLPSGARAVGSRVAHGPSVPLVAHGPSVTHLTHGPSVTSRRTGR